MPPGEPLLSETFHKHQELIGSQLESVAVQGRATFPQGTRTTSKDLKGIFLLGLCEVRDSQPLLSFFRCNSFIENASALKKPQAKLKKMHNLGHKNNNPPKEPQPKRVEEVYRALKNGLE